MEDLQARHRKEQRDLQSRITQKKKQATKKTRKGVNDECASLERELKERQAQEMAALSGPGDDGAAAAEPPNDNDNDDEPVEDPTTTAPTSASATPTQPTNGVATTPAARKPNRQKARLARRAAEAEAATQEAAQEAASMPDQRRAERTALLAQFAARGLREQVIRADGHCLYSAVADQMGSLSLGLAPRVQANVIGSAAGNGVGENDDGAKHAYRVVRNVAADYIAAHGDDFAPFLEEPLDAYVAKVRETGEWGGHMELMALARSYNLPIKVLHADGRVDVIDPAVEGEGAAGAGVGGGSGGGSRTNADDGKEAEGKELWLAYYRHGFGLGEHYNSLRRAEKATETTAAAA